MSARQRRALTIIAFAAILGSPSAATAAAPTVVTSDAYSTSATTAIVKGQVDPGGESTTYAMQYDVASSGWCASGGTSDSPANTLGAAGAISAVTSVSFNFSGLTSGTSYCAQLVATNGSGQAAGGQVQWTQGPGETVTANVEGNVYSGIVTSSPAGIACGEGNPACILSFRPGTAVTLTATPAAGFAFSGWSGACSGTGTCTIPGTTVDADVAATFNELPSSTLIVELAGNCSGTVTSGPQGIGSPGEIDCSSTDSACSAQFLGGEQVTLTASPTRGRTSPAGRAAAARARAAPAR